jgi:phosphoglycolate phosphatase-like HAD superfamily hydrolase
MGVPVNCGFDRIRTHLRWFYEEYKVGKLLASFGVVATIWFVAALVICRAETSDATRRGATSELFGTLPDCLWGTTVYLVSGLEEFEPRTAVSKVAAVTVMIAGVGALGMVGARLAATFVEHSRRQGLLRRLPHAKLRNHVVVCGWPEGGERLLAELRAACDCNATIVVVDEEADTIRLPSHRRWPGVWGLVGNPTDDSVLRLAQVDQAHSAIVVPPPSGSPKRQERARELMIVLALRAVAPRLHITVPAPGEPTVQRLLDRQCVESPVVNGVSSRLLAHACQKHFLTDFFERLLASGDETNSVHEIPLPTPFVGHNFVEFQRRLAAWEGGDLTLVGIRHPEADGTSTLIVNPRHEDGRHRPLLAEDRLLILARRRPDLAALAESGASPS